ncbi:TATA element modulatory factor [Diachasma alloeum]|uniref:TATA element modulatory factor n=1 Tax=Diachasma alloeum TaxID=454923 RepID=UPI0007384DA6|nr:TATA element modulatory factor [Diachasma alloeum]
MSWFDASGFASLAKSALKEAQKTIDKALDIKEEEQRAAGAAVINESNFFSAWGIKSETELPSDAELASTSGKNDSSIWGSFTGSFFETPGKDGEGKIPRRSESFDDKSESPSTAITPSMSLPDSLTRMQSRLAAKIPDDLETQQLNPQAAVENPQRPEKSPRREINELESKIVSDSSRISEKRDSLTQKINRISIISSGSDKRSSESVEILGSRSETNTDCTTTPESDLISPSTSLSASAIDAKRNSDSVEVLPDSSVTSPSSVEILEDRSKSESFFLSISQEKSPDGGTTSIEPDSDVTQGSDVSSSDISPYASPLEETKIPRIEDSEIPGSLPQTRLMSLSVEKTSSPINVEAPQSVDELDEISQAEDSYTSASESTTVMTVLETIQQQIDQSKGKMYESGESKPICMAPVSSQLESNLDSLKDVKQSLHLALEPITTQPIRKSECLAEKMESYDPDIIKSTTIEPSEFDETCSEYGRGSSETAGTLLTDSSCEGTLIETSSEEIPTLRNTQEEEGEEAPLTSSSYVKNMLADAMVEKGEIIGGLEGRGMEIPPRENSPISSESRSDLVKIGSDHASGHTSGDELETTTSSDIEIISSPNGDSSSTQSRQSPANLHCNKASDLLTKTLKIRGHSRELSEISIGSDAASLEIEKLLKRIQEMNEILEVRESKLIDVSRMNMELHEQNNHLKIQLEFWEKRGQQHQDLNVITDEYTQRMSALEKKFQQTIRERDLLKDQLETLKKEMSSQSSSANAEKDEIINQLREEGEKLSKQQLQHSNIIKKLRTKEKENETTLKTQKDHLEELTSELERLKRSLHAKEEVERSQIEAVHTLTARAKKQDKDITMLQEKLDTTVQKMNAYKMSLDAAKAELTETKINFTTVEEELKQALDNAGESCRLGAQVEDLKAKLRQTEENHVRKIESIKLEKSELLKRLEAAETRSEELSESVSLATQPLLRQLEQLQTNLAHKSSAYLKQEKIMSEKIDELQTKLDSTIATDRSLMEENLNLKSKVTSLESQAKRKDVEKTKLEETCEALKLESEKLTVEIESLRGQIGNMEKTHQEEVRELRREIESLSDKLSVEKAAIDAEKRKNIVSLEQQQGVGEEARMSPTSSLRRDSISSTNSVWLAFNDSVFDTSSGRFPNVYEGLRTSTNTTSTIETLQAQLKAREGEIQTLQWELSRRNKERDALEMELSNLSQKVDELTAKLTEVEALNANLNEIQTRYDALLQMYGEKVEETEELRLDLEDVKDMYKSQIDQLLKRDT